MDIFLNILLPFFGIIAIGYLCRAVGILHEKTTEALNDFVYWVALPVLVFQVMSDIDIHRAFHVDFVLAYFSTSAVVMLLGWLIGRHIFGGSMTESAMSLMNAAYGNSGFLGIPLILAIFGTAAASPMVVAVMCMLLVSNITLAIIEMSKTTGEGKLKMLSTACLRTVRVPIFFAPLVGLALSYLEIKVPLPLESIVAILADAATPCALFMIGTFMYGKPVFEAFSEVSLSCILKLLISPLLFFVFTLPFDIPDLWFNVGLLLSATPTGAGSFVLAQRFGVSEKRTSSIIFVSTVLSMFVLLSLLNFVVLA